MGKATRICRKCGEEQPLETGFYLKTSPRRRHPFWSSQCRTCTQAYMNDRNKAKRDYVKAYKVSRGCMDCGLKIDRPEVYDLDHRPGEGKWDKVSAVVVKGNMDDVIAECARCDVVCANCHRIRTEDRNIDGSGNNPREWDIRKRERLAALNPNPSLFDFLDGVA